VRVVEWPPQNDEEEMEGKKLHINEWRNSMQKKINKPTVFLGTNITLPLNKFSIILFSKLPLGRIMMSRLTNSRNDTQRNDNQLNDKN
jgi:hypothetical protein